jgi:hypothetical protein
VLEGTRNASAAAVLEIIGKRGERGLPVERLYRQMFNPKLYPVAYGRIFANAGAMRTPIGLAGADGWLGRRARQRTGVEVSDLVDTLSKLPAVRCALIAVVVDGVVQLRAAVAHAPEL